MNNSLWKKFPIRGINFYGSNYSHKDKPNLKTQTYLSRVVKEM